MNLAGRLRQMERRRGVGRDGPIACEVWRHDRDRAGVLINDATGEACTASELAADGGLPCTLDICRAGSRDDESDDG
jgi:hypothetical protein